MGCSWGVLGCSLASWGALGAVSGCAWSTLGVLFDCSPGVLLVILDAFGVLLGARGGALGAYLEHSKDFKFR